MFPLYFDLAGPNGLGLVVISENGETRPIRRVERLLDDIANASRKVGRDIERISQMVERTERIAMVYPDIEMDALLDIKASLKVFADCNNVLQSRFIQRTDYLEGRAYVKDDFMELEANFVIFSEVRTEAINLVDQIANQLEEPLVCPCCSEPGSRPPRERLGEQRKRGLMMRGALFVVAIWLVRMVVVWAMYAKNGK